MLIRTRIPAADCPPDALAAQALELTAAQRRRSRQRIALDRVELGIALPPGTSLEPGDQLLADDGRRFEGCAAAETVLRISADDASTLARAAYHLGNRHVAVEVGAGYLAIEPDPVLEASDTLRMRGDKPFVMTDLRRQQGLADVVACIEREGLVGA